MQMLSVLSAVVSLVSSLSLDRMPIKGQTVYHRWFRNADGTPCRFKVTSVKRWKKDPSRFQIGLKRGLYEFSTVTSHIVLSNFTADPTDILPDGVKCANGETENVCIADGKEYVWTWTPSMPTGERHRYWSFDDRKFVEYSEVCPDKM